MSMVKHSANVDVIVQLFIEECVCVCVCYTTMCVRVHGGGEESKPMAKIIVNVNV